MKLRGIRSPFFQGMLKSSFCGWLLGRSPSGGLSVTSPRRAVGFPLQSLTWVKGDSPFGFISRNTGCSLTASATDHPGRLHGRSRTSGRKDKRRLTVLPYTCPARISLPWERAFPTHRKASSSCTRQVTYH